MRRYIPALAAVTVAIASAASASTISPSEYVPKAGAAGLYERQSRELVLQSTKDAKVRDFSTIMIADHTKSTADITAAVRLAGFQPAPHALDSMQAEMTSPLRATSGPPRDAAYLTHQKVAHAKGFELHSTHATDRTSAPLKSAATMNVPVV